MIAGFRGGLDVLSISDTEGPLQHLEKGLVYHKKISATAILRSSYFRLNSRRSPPDPG